MMRLGRTIILSGVVSVCVFVAPVHAQLIQSTVEAAPVATDDRFEEPRPERVQTPTMHAPLERPAIVRPKANAGFSTRSRGGTVGGRTEVPMGVDDMMGRDDFSYGTVIPATGQPGKRMRMRTVVRQVTEVVPVEIPEEEKKEAKQIRVLIKKLRETKEDDEEQRTVLTKSIQAIFNTQFERDLKQREDALAPLEARVKTLRKQLDKRKSAQGEIIDLRLKMIVNEIDGLAFPGEEGNVEETTVPARRAKAADSFEKDSPNTYDPNLVPIEEPQGRSTDGPAVGPSNTTTVEPDLR